MTETTTTESDAAPTGPDAAPVARGPGEEARGAGGLGSGTKGAWFAGLDGVRAIAAFGVLVTHVGLISGYVTRGGTAGQLVSRGEVGVAVFFVLSGFLLYRPFVSARMDGRPSRSLPRYLRHRFLRIFPAYWVAFTVLVVVLDARHLGSLTPWELVMYYSLMQSFSEVTALGGLQQAWTLHNEVMFYLLLPLWAAGAGWLGRRLAPRRALVAELGVLAGLAVACLGWRMWLQSVRVSTAVEDFDPRFHWLLGNFHMFVPGMALALGLEWSRRRERPLAVLEVIRRHPLVSWGVACASFWAVSTSIGLGTQVGAESPAQDLGKELLYASIGFFLVAPVALAGRDLPRSLSWLGTRVMVTLGLLSYAVYLWHEGVIDIYVDHYELTVFRTPLPPMMAAAVVGSLAVAALSYLAIERPALRFKDPRTRRAAGGPRPDATVP